MVSQNWYTIADSISSRAQYGHPRISCGFLYPRIVLQFCHLRQLHDRHRVHGVAPHQWRTDVALSLQPWA